MSKNLKTTEDQYAHFFEIARALGCDEDEATFDEKLERIVKQDPKRRNALIEEES